MYMIGGVTAGMKINYDINFSVIVFIIAAIILIAAYFLQFHFDKREEERHRKIREVEKRRTESTVKLAEVIGNLTINEVEFRSIKRHIGMLLIRLDEVEEKIDGYMESERTPYSPLDNIDSIIADAEQGYIDITTQNEGDE